MIRQSRHYVGESSRASPYITSIRLWVMLPLTHQNA